MPVFAIYLSHVTDPAPTSLATMCCLFLCEETCECCFECIECCEMC